MNIIYITILLLVIKSVDAGYTYWYSHTNVSDCPRGYYNTSYDTIGECKGCWELRSHYYSEKCCYHEVEYTTPYRVIDSVVSYTPMRTICNHLRKEWSKCPRQCDIFTPGVACNHSTQCRFTHTCLNGRCCSTKDSFCTSCDHIGLCNQCTYPFSVNATGNKCGICPNNKYNTNGVCFYPSNCTPGEYILSEYTSTSDRLCSMVPNGTYTNSINANNFTFHTNCSSNNTTVDVIGNNTHDSICRNTSVCKEYEYLIEKEWGKDENCTNKSICDLGQYIVKNVCYNCTNGTFTNESNLEICYNHTDCNGSYVYNGNTTHDSKCVN